MPWIGSMYFVTTLFIFVCSFNASRESFLCILCDFYYVWHFNCFVFGLAFCFLLVFSLYFSWGDKAAAMAEGSQEKEPLATTLSACVAKRTKKWPDNSLTIRRSGRNTRSSSQAINYAFCHGGHGRGPKVSEFLQPKFGPEAPMPCGTYCWQLKKPQRHWLGAHSPPKR